MTPLPTHLVVADTSPLFYLLAIGQVDLLPRLFERILIPDAVHREILHPTAPAALRNWAARPPDWLEITPPGGQGDVMPGLGSGESAAIALAISVAADLLLIDERKGASAALRNGVRVTGTLGVLRLAAQRDLIDLADCLERIKRTNFRYRQEMLDDLLREVRSGS